jgi:hypothetical protein|tara:strand:+ start:587 stop:958 length:372 start_codon:yes stop_codon:yes gene_type:complete
MGTAQKIGLAVLVANLLGCGGEPGIEVNGLRPILVNQQGNPRFIDFRDSDDIPVRIYDIRSDGFFPFDHDDTIDAFSMNGGRIMIATDIPPNIKNDLSEVYRRVIHEYSSPDYNIPGSLRASR